MKLIGNILLHLVSIFPYKILLIVIPIIILYPSYKIKQTPPSTDRLSNRHLPHYHRLSTCHTTIDLPLATSLLTNHLPHYQRLITCHTTTDLPLATSLPTHHLPHHHWLATLQPTHHLPHYHWLATNAGNFSCQSLHTLTAPRNDIS